MGAAVAPDAGWARCFTPRFRLMPSLQEKEDPDAEGSSADGPAGRAGSQASPGASAGTQPGRTAEGGAGTPGSEVRRSDGPVEGRDRHVPVHGGV